MMQGDNAGTSAAVGVVYNCATRISQETSLQVQECVCIKLLARVPDYIHDDIGNDVAVYRQCVVQDKIYLGRVFDVKGRQHLVVESKGYKSLYGAFPSLGGFREITLEPMGVDADVTLEMFDFIGGFQLKTRQSRNNCRCSFKSGRDIR